jgi:hypothetical protein
MSPATEALISELTQHAERMADALEDLLFTDTTNEDREQFKAIWQGYVDFADQITTRTWSAKRDGGQ